MVAVARRQPRQRLPRTLGAFPTAGGNITPLLGPSELFVFNVLAAIHYTGMVGGRAGAFERLIRVGRVPNVQQNGCIQVTVPKELGGMRSYGRWFEPRTQHRWGA